MRYGASDEEIVEFNGVMDEGKIDFDYIDLVASFMGKNIIHSMSSFTEEEQKSALLSYLVWVGLL